MKPGTTWVMHRFGFRRVLIGNGLLVAAGFAGCALLGPAVPYGTIAALLFLCGMARSMQFTALNTIGFADMPKPLMRDATTLFSICQQMNAALGIAIGALVLAVAEWLRGSDPGHASTGDFQLAFWMITGLSLLAIVDSVLLPGDAGQQLLAARSEDQGTRS